jgi:hypothetical protein
MLKTWISAGANDDSAKGELPIDSPLAFLGDIR